VARSVARAVMCADTRRELDGCSVDRSEHPRGLPRTGRRPDRWSGLPAAAAPARYQRGHLAARRRRRARQPQRHVPGQRRTRHAVAAYIPGSW
jgi:hypothetical protein